jgi:osomolarity two-component system sensor histidine kinase TcsA
VVEAGINLVTAKRRRISDDSVHQLPMDVVTKALGANVPAMSEIFDFLPVPTLVVSPSYHIQRASAGLLEAWGRKREELIDQDLFIALYQGSLTERFDRIPLAYAIETALAARALRLCYAAYIADGISWTARIVPVHRDDELLCLILEWDKAELYTTVSDGVMTQSWQPIDDAFRILVQAVKDYAIFLLDTRGNVMTWNTGAELNKGYKKEEIIGKHFSTFYSEEDIRSRKPERELEICLREGRAEDEGWRYRKDGSRFWANVVITAIYKNNIHVGFGKVTRDLTERKEAELRLIAAYEESTKLKNDFLANISHEIRTPMHGVLSACSLLLDSRLTEEQRETANIIEESGHVLLRIINDILDYSKIAAGSFSIENDKVDIASVATSVVHSVQTTVQPGVSLRLSLSPNLPKWAEGDPLRCRQVVENIASNAVKFTEQGYILVSVSLLAEDVATYTILTEVYDTGHGVTQGDAQKLFKPFTQLDTPYQKRRQGTGLGLSISKSIAELLGGNVGYKPNPERQGSIFWFSVKLKKLSSLQRTQIVDALPSDVVQFVQPCCTYVRTERKCTYTYYVRTIWTHNILNKGICGSYCTSTGLYKNSVGSGSSSTHSAILSRLKVSPKRWRPPKLTLPSFGDSLSTSAALTPRKASDTDAVTAKRILQRPLLGGRKSISLRVRNGKPSSDKSVKLKITLAIFPHIQKLYKRR